MSAQVHPRVAFLIPEATIERVFTAETLEHLRRVVDLRAIAGDGAAISAAIPELLDGAEACLTGWGTPPLIEATLNAAPSLRLIAHTAGSVKRLIPASVFERGIAVSHAANIIADAVAEFAILNILLGLRRVHEMDRAMKSGGAWREAAVREQRQLASRTVGVVGAGYVGRKVIRFLAPFGPRVVVYDPYLSATDAAALGVTSVGLNDLFAESEVVTIHAPITPETHHLVGAEQLALLQDGAVFVNCGRSWTVDQDALLSTLRTGRIWAALDVFDEEPLPADSPFRGLSNTLITPHQAGYTLETYLRQGQAMVEEIERFFAGQPLKYQIRPEAFAVMA